MSTEDEHDGEIIIGMGRVEIGASIKGEGQFHYDYTSLELIMEALMDAQKQVLDLMSKEKRKEAYSLALSLTSK
tara:strand:+ start:60 stop:281 length:222 start_codon:yes stop_codon:yes gene_type:complete